MERLDEIREQEAIPNPIRYYTDGKPYLQIAGIEITNHPAVEKLAEYDRIEKYVLPTLEDKLSQLGAQIEDLAKQNQHNLNCYVAEHDKNTHLTVRIEALGRALRANDDERCYSCKSFYVLDSEEKCSECEPCFDGDRWQFAENRFAGG